MYVSVCLATGEYIGDFRGLLISEWGLGRGFAVSVDILVFMAISTCFFL